MNDVPRPLAVAVVIVDCSAVIGVASKKNPLHCIQFQVASYNTHPPTHPHTHTHTHYLIRITHLMKDNFQTTTYVLT